MNNLVLHGFPVSSNTHRVRLLLSLLDLPFEERVVHLAKGEQYDPEFTSLNPRQSVPVLETEGELLNESYAIMIYLVQQHGGSDGERWWPAEAVNRARVASWMFYTANELHNGIGLTRNERAFGIPSGAEYAALRAAKSLTYLEAHLASRTFLELERPTLADVSIYPFVAVAPEAGLSLKEHPALQRWIGRLEGLPGFLPMPMLKDLQR